MTHSGWSMLAQAVIILPSLLLIATMAAAGVVVLSGMAYVGAREVIGAVRRLWT